MGDQYEGPGCPVFAHIAAAHRLRRDWSWYCRNSVTSALATIRRQALLTSGSGRNRTDQDVKDCILRYDVWGAHKKSVGLEDGTSQAPDVLIPDGLMELTIEAPTGLIRADTDRLRLNGMNNGPGFSEITFFLTAESLEDFTALIRDGVDSYGIPNESAEDWIESMSSQPEDKSNFALAPGTSTGLQVQYDLRYDGSKDVQVIIVHVSPA
jgi:hypothetical protein